MDIGRHEILLHELKFPPRPEVVTVLAEESTKEQPDLARIGKLVKADVALAGAMLKAINSPLWGRSRKITSVKQAIDLLGLSNVKSIATGLVLRTSLGMSSAQNMERFWDSAEKVALISALIARGQSGITPDEAYTYGLFHDCGIPMLLRRFPGYRAALVKANQTEEGSFTATEEQGVGTHHAVVGYFLARSWGLSDAVTNAILLHHEVDILDSADAAESTLDFIALGHLAQHIVHLMSRDSRDIEWERFGAATMKRFGLSDDDFLDLQEEAQAVKLAA